MRIGIDARMYRSSVAGIGRYSQNLIRNLLEIDKENQYVFFMTTEDKKEFKNYLIENSLKIAFRHSNLKLKIIEVDIPHFSLAEQFKLPKIIAQEKLDLMHFLNFNFPVFYRGKFISVIHDLTLLKFPQTAKNNNFFKKWAYGFVMKKACQNSEKIIAVSENTKKDIVKVFKTDPSKIKVIYEAADDKIEKIRNPKHEIRNKFKIKEPIILYVGQFRKHKNIEGLIKAYRILKKEIPCQLAILGRKDGYNLDKTLLKEDIEMPGFVSDKELACWYETASVFVFPSFYEGFGLPGLEAMDAGLPVVSSNRGSLPEIYQNAALYFNPFDFQDIADKIKMVLRDERLRQDLIKKGKNITKQYSWRKTARETLDLYRQIQKS